MNLSIEKVKIWAFFETVNEVIWEFLIKNLYCIAKKEEFKDQQIYLKALQK